MTLIRFLAIAVILAGGTLAFLSFAPPQTGQWVYMWQAYVWPKDEKINISPPGYTGIWRTWHPNGKLQMEMPLDNGKVCGPYFSWNENGMLALSVEPVSLDSVFNKKICLYAADGHLRELALGREFSKDRKVVLTRTLAPDGTLTAIVSTDSSQDSYYIYSPEEDIDRRAEFGIAAE